MKDYIKELNKVQLDTISGGHCHRHHCGHSGSSGLGGGIIGQLEGIIKELGKSVSNTNISIIIIANSTINGTLGISVNQSISH